MDIFNSQSSWDIIKGFGVYIYQPYLYTFMLTWQGVFFCGLLYVINRQYDTFIFWGFGWRGILVLSWLGTVIHELSHAAMAWLFTHKIVEIKLFSPNRTTGSLGYVVNKYPRYNDFFRRYLIEVLGNVIVALAPFFGGTFTIYLLIRYLFSDFFPIEEIEKGVRWINIFENNWPLLWKTLLREMSVYAWPILDAFGKSEMFRDWKFYVMAYLLLSVSSGIVPSPSDFQVLKSYLPGLLVSYWIFFMIFFPGYLMITEFFHRNGYIKIPPRLLLYKMVSFANGILFFSVLLSLIFLLFIMFIALLKVQLAGPHKDAVIKKHRR